MENFLPNATANEFLTECYRYFLSRESDADGREYFLAEMAKGMTRQSVIQVIVSSDEFIHRFNDLSSPNRSNVVSAFRKFSAEGHFYSPIPASDDFNEKYDALALGEIGDDLIDAKAQLELADRFKIFYDELPFPEEPSDRRRFYLNNGAFNYFDGIILYSFIRYLKPKRIIEVGSGYSSAAMIDTCEMYLEGKTDITFIEPYPDTLHQRLSAQDEKRYTILDKNVQDVGLDAFGVLERNDILFIDSSHVSKFGSDVNHLLFNVIPTLKEGVVIHFHDIFRNFDYPKEWLNEGRAWNEGYLVRAFLSQNKNFKILFFNDWFAHNHWDYLADNMPLCSVQPKAARSRTAGSVCGCNTWEKPPARAHEVSGALALHVMKVCLSSEYRAQFLDIPCPGIERHRF